MNLLSAENISKSFNERWLLKNQTIGLSQGDKVALVGINGTGKTTLLRILAGEIEPDGGIVSVRKGIRMSYLSQQPSLPDNLSIRELLYSDDNPVMNVVREYEAAMLNPDTNPDKMQELLEQMEALDAWDFESTQTQVLGKLNIEDQEQLWGTLSGGQRKRVALARMLLARPDLIMLDEPTNHLDLDAIEWLETFLGSHLTTLLMVTHDRYFLDNVANRIIELDGGQLYFYEGNYAYFLEKKAERDAIKKSEVEKARNLLSKELEWMRRQPKARGTKAKYRIDAFYEIKEKASQNLSKDSLELNMAASRQGGKVMEINGLNKAIGNRKLVTNFDYVFRKGERIGIVGRNGAGKSTFLNLITGRLAPDTGEIDKGETTKPGYYTQEVDNLNPENRIIDEIKEIAEFITLGNGETVSVSRLLTQFLFPPAAQYGYISKLSGGEKRRLQLLKVLVASPNFLILDEPTNDLDIDTLNVLEDFLDNFPGCLLLVSHDRYFMDKLVESLFVFEGRGKITIYNGNYSDYRLNLGQETVAENSQSGSKANKQGSESKTSQSAYADLSKKKPSQKLLRELEQVEASIEDKEKQKSDLVTKLGLGGSFDQISQITASINTLDKELATLMEKWETLSAQV